MMLKPGYKQLQYTYCPISQEVKAIRQWNLVSWYNITSETFFWKSHMQNLMEELFPDPFLQKNKHISGLIV